MDLFPKDYKKNNSPPITPGSAPGAFSFLKGAKDRIAGGGNINLSSRVTEVILRLGMIISIGAFFLVLVLWGGLYFYERVLIGQISSLKKQQAEVFSVQDKEIAAKIVALDKSAAIALTLLKNHVYVSELFNKLAAATVPRVQWQSFDLSVKERSLALKGFSADYATLAKQILALSEEGFLNVKVTNIALDKTGGVSFMAAFNFDPKILQK